MFPSFLAFVAIYLLFFQIGDVAPFIGLGTHFGLIMVYLGGSIGFNSWLIKGFYGYNSNESLDEAAKVDGATDSQIFFRIVAPLARPIIVVLFVISFIGIYSDYILAAIFLKDTNLYTVALGINIVFMDDFSNEWGSIAAASVIAATPIAVLFIFFQKQINRWFNCRINKRMTKKALFISGGWEGHEPIETSEFISRTNYQI